MRLFQILTRLVATGKIKVTQKLVDRLGGETAGKHSVAPLKPRRRKYHGLVCLCSATIAVLLMLPVGLASLRAATIAQPAPPQDGGKGQGRKGTSAGKTKPCQGLVQPG